MENTELKQELEKLKSKIFWLESRYAALYGLLFIRFGREALIQVDEYMDGWIQRNPLKP